jgi:hypothetical protein
MSYQKVRVKVPHQLIGSGEHLLGMHPEQYYLDELGDMIISLRARGLSPEDITMHVSKYEPDFPLSRTKILIALADRKILWYLTGEVSRDVDDVSKKLASLRERKFSI